MGVVHRPSQDWGSHIPVLIKCLELTDGPVLEMGMGIFSTPLLNVLCFAQDRCLSSYDNDGRFIEQFKSLRSPTHEIELVDWSELDNLGVGNQWSVVLLDHKPAIQRREDARRLVDTDYLILHDSQNRAEEYYGYEEIYPLFKYRYDYKKFANQTTVLSNKHELHQFYNSLG